MKFSFCAIWTMILMVLGGAAQAARPDSLWGCWTNESLPDSLRINAINEYSWLYRTNRPDSMLYFASLGLEFAKSRNNAKGVDVSLNNMGIAYIQKAELDSAIHYFNLGFLNAEERRDYKRMGIIKVNISTIYGMQDMLMNSLDELNQGLHYLELAGDSTGFVKANGNRGIIYRKLGEYEKALAIYHESLSLSIVYGLSETQALAYNNIANIHEVLGNQDSALYYYRLALPINKKNQNLQGEARVYQNLASTFNGLEIYDSAFYYARKAIALQVSIGDLFSQTNSLNTLGAIYLATGKKDSTIYYSKQALDISLKIGSLESQRDAHKMLYHAFEAKGNYAKAYEHYLLFTGISDSVESEGNLKALAQQELRYNYMKQKDEDSLNHQRELMVLQVESEKQQVIEEEASRRNRVILIGVLLVLLLVGGIAFVLFRSNKRRKADNVIISRQKEEVELQKHILEEKNAEITDSINYARRIQSAILPPAKMIQAELPDSFVLYLPKDIVAGDFYWSEALDEQFLLAVADCTGHGVPGALVSVVCYNALNRSVREFGLRSPEKILDKTRELVIETFERHEDQVRDGMDISLISLGKPDAEGNRQLLFSGANNPIYIIRGNGLNELKGDKQPVGKFENSREFQVRREVLQPGDQVYLFSDGFADQFGGSKGKKLKYQSFKEFLVENRNQICAAKRDALESYFKNWKGNFEQVDDVCIIGFSV